MATLLRGVPAPNTREPANRIGAASDAGLAYLQQRFGCPIRNDVHGIDIYEPLENLKFVSIGADAVVGKNPATFVEVFERELLGKRTLTEKQVLAGEIYSASFFDISPRSRLLTLMTAVEALLEPARRPEPVQALVTEMQQLSRASMIDETTKISITSSLQWLRSDSIGESGRKLAARLLPSQLYGGRSSAAFFGFCYSLRSQIVHRGATEDAMVDILSLADNAEVFVSELLLASIHEG